MNRIRLIVVIAFFIAGGLLYYAYTRMQLNIKQLQTTVKENAEPNQDLIRIKELYISISSVGNNVRAFSVTHDQSYLVSFLEMKDSLNAGIDSLKSTAILSGRNINSLLELDSLLDKKVGIYDSLLDISYNMVVADAIDKMDIQQTDNDSVILSDNEGNVFQRMFSNRYSRKTIQARADSLINERNSRIKEFKANVLRIREEEARLLKIQNDRELALLNADKITTSAIERLILRLEKEERERIYQKANLSKASADEAVKSIKQIVIAGFILILFLLLFVFRDIEISNKRRKELVEARLKAEKLARAKEDFMSTMSHEIRTPLTSIIGFSDKLSQTALDYNQQKYMKAITGSSDHLLSIVNDVLDFTRVDSGKLKFDQVPFKAADIFIEVFDSFTWKAEEKKIKLNLFVQPIATLVLHGDPVRLRQVLFNLVGNAVKFTSKGSVDITATFTEEQSKAILLFKISDTGIGIANEKIDVIFNEFEQAENSTEKEYGGSGLGLAITKRIIEQQGGTITAESNQGLGSVFISRIPFAYGELTQRESSFTEDLNDQPLKGLSMILAEDDPMIRELQYHSLEAMGAKVMLAENGKEAVEILQNNDADFILMDIQMPELTGPEALKIIRNSFPEPKKNIPVIAMTANVLQHDIIRWLEEGMNDFITKPFREQELIEKISKLLKIERTYAEAVSIPEVKVIEPYEFSMARPDKLYDLKELIDASQGNSEFIKKMINLFLTSSFASVNNLKFHLKQNNWEQLAKTSHRMIGSYKQMGMDYVAAMLKELEGTALDSRELGKAAFLVSETEKYSNEIFKMLKSELENY